jgi:hypothetical protein
MAAPLGWTWTGRGRPAQPRQPRTRVSRAGLRNGSKTSDTQSSPTHRFRQPFVRIKIQIEVLPLVLRCANCLRRTEVRLPQGPTEVGVPGKGIRPDVGFCWCLGTGFAGSARPGRQSRRTVCRGRASARARDAQPSTPLLPPCLCASVRDLFCAPRVPRRSLCTGAKAPLVPSLRLGTAAPGSTGARWSGGLSLHQPTLYASGLRA